MFRRYVSSVSGWKSDNFYKQNSFVLLLWVLISIIFVIDLLATNRINNYLIFENTFRNLIHERSLYDAYPAYHEDANHYGPVFSVLMAPFYLMPNGLGLLIWNLFNCFFLFKAIQTLPLTEDKKVMIGYIAIPCVVASMLNQQFNAGAGALMILSFTQLNRKGGFWSAMCIAFGTMVKLYGIVGLVFFFFSKEKKSFVLYLIFWFLIFFALPMVFSSPDFVLHSYIDWKNSLINKNMHNIAGASSDISIMGFFRNLLSVPDVSNTFFLSIGSILFMLPFLSFSAFSRRKFQLRILASVLIFPILFSTGSEDCTYIISITGVGIWFVLEKNLPLRRVLLPLLLIFTCNFPLLLFPVFAKSHPLLLSMLSFPYAMVWMRLIYSAVKQIREKTPEPDLHLSYAD